jgi:hypothetical protein
MPDLTKAEELEGLEVAGAKPRFHVEGEDADEDPEESLAELIVPLRSPVIDKSLRDSTSGGATGSRSSASGGTDTPSAKP